MDLFLKTFISQVTKNYTLTRKKTQNKLIWENIFTIQSLQITFQNNSTTTWQNTLNVAYKRRDLLRSPLSLAEPIRAVAKKIKLCSPLQYLERNSKKQYPTRNKVVDWPKSDTMPHTENLQGKVIVICSSSGVPRRPPGCCLCLRPRWALWTWMRRHWRKRRRAGVNRWSLLHLCYVKQQSVRSPKHLCNWKINLNKK